MIKTAVCCVMRACFGVGAVEMKKNDAIYVCICEGSMRIHRIIEHQHLSFLI